MLAIMLTSNIHCDTVTSAKVDSQLKTFLLKIGTFYFILHHPVQ